MMVVVFLALLSRLSYAEDSPPVDKTRLWEQFATHSYSNLNDRLSGALTPIFHALGDIGEVYQYFYTEHGSVKYEAYRQFLIQAFYDAKHGDVGEAMFASAMIELTPAEVMLPMIAPEIGPLGKLSGILDGNSDVAKHIQRQNQQGYYGDPNFDHYVYYLQDNNNRGYKSLTNADIIVEHMIHTDPQKAFISMLWVDYGFLPYARGNCYGGDAEETRRLQLAHAAISDYLFRRKYDFPMREGQEDEVRKLLLQLSQHDKSWVRLYAEQIAKECPPQQDITQSEQ